MSQSFGRGALASCVLALVAQGVLAQVVSPSATPAPASASPAADAGAAPPAAPIPYAQTQGAAADAGAAAPAAPIPYAQAPAAPYAQAPIAPYASAWNGASTSSLSPADRRALQSALWSAKRGDGPGAQQAMAQITDPVARKLALWAIVDSAGEQLTFMQLDQARRDLAGWPRAQRRQQAAERTLEISGLGPQQTIAWFADQGPVSPQGVMALVAAYQLSGRTADAQALIRRWWRDQPFDADTQRTFRARFGAYITADDDAARESMLLYGSQTGAARDLYAYLSPDEQALAQARMALRDDRSDAQSLVDLVPPALATDPGLAFERARYLQKRGLDQDATALAPYFPTSAPTPEAAGRIWALCRQLINTAMRAGDYRAAYALATHNGLSEGSEYTEAQFYAGWLDLAKLGDPAGADAHFAEIQRLGQTPITVARALYWRGRAADVVGEDDLAQTFYQAAGRYSTTFYGQLGAQRAGQRMLVLQHDPVITAADTVRFNAHETVQAARDLGDLGETDLLKIFVLNIAESLPDAAEAALLVDLTRTYGDQDLAMKVVRAAAQHGQVLPERGYPIRNAPLAADSPEPAIVFGITRQESGFDPRVRSGVGARGMMQLMPATAQSVARRLGEPFSSGMLDEPDYNMRLGSSYLGHIIDGFNGSYVMGAAAYNAGPGRPLDWVGYCGDPRASSVDPVDFIECIPFSETRNYVMRVLEATQVYRARLNNGEAPLTLAQDLKRGGYVYGGPPPVAPVPTLAAAAAQSPTSSASDASAQSAPATQPAVKTP